jgi:hypothetical protein
LGINSQAAEALSEAMNLPDKRPHALQHEPKNLSFRAASCRFTPSPYDHFV